MQEKPQKNITEPVTELAISKLGGFALQSPLHSWGAPSLYIYSISYWSEVYIIIIKPQFDFFYIIKKKRL